MDNNGYPVTHSFDKPIIYLYPKEETEITVKLGYPERTGFVAVEWGGSEIE